MYKLGVKDMYWLSSTSLGSRVFTDTWTILLPKYVIEETSNSWRHSKTKLISFAVNVLKWCNGTVDF